MKSTAKTRKPQTSPSKKSAATEKPAKIVVSSHPFPCDCNKCGMEYCDCSEPERGTVKASSEVWK